jgi:hypothetical protein
VHYIVDLNSCALFQSLLLLLLRWISTNIDFAVLDSNQGRVNLIHNAIYLLSEQRKDMKERFLTSEVQANVHRERIRCNFVASKDVFIQKHFEIAGGWELLEGDPVYR